MLGDMGTAPRLAETVNRPEDWREETLVPPPAPAKKPTIDKRTAEQIVEDAHAAKRRATQDWIAGLISSEEHVALHGRADHIIQNRGRLV